MIYTKRIEEAIYFATAAHEGQKRKVKGEPYIVHPLSVALILARLGSDEDVIIAGLLHDLVEDTKVTLEEIRKRFGNNVAELVDHLTEQEKPTWEERKNLAKEHIKEMPQGALLVKSAEVLYNMRNILIHRKEMGDKVYSFFGAPKEKNLAHFDSRIKELSKAWPENPLLPELQEVMDRLME